MTACTDDRCGRGRYLCFKHKLAHWRSEGSPFVIPNHFRAANREGYTQRELFADTRAATEAQGLELIRAK